VDPVMTAVLPFRNMRTPHSLDAAYSTAVQL